MRILFLTNAHNSLSQRAYLELTQRSANGYKVDVVLAQNEAQMTRAAEAKRYDVVICPFLTKKVPERIWKTIPCWIVHPGIHGDRGMHSLDWALMSREQEWGVTILNAAEEVAVLALSVLALSVLALPPWPLTPPLPFLDGCGRRPRLGWISRL